MQKLSFYYKRYLSVGLSVLLLCSDALGTNIHSTTTTGSKASVTDFIYANALPRKKKNKKKEEAKPVSDYKKLTGRDSVNFEGVMNVVKKNRYVLPRNSYCLNEKRIPRYKPTAKSSQRTE